MIYTASWKPYINETMFVLKTAVGASYITRTHFLSEKQNKLFEQVNCKRNRLNTFPTATQNCESDLRVLYVYWITR